MGTGSDHLLGGLCPTGENCITLFCEGDKMIFILAFRKNNFRIGFREHLFLDCKVVPCNVGDENLVFCHAVPFSCHDKSSFG